MFLKGEPLVFQALPNYPNEKIHSEDGNYELEQIVMVYTDLVCNIFKYTVYF